MDEAVRSRVVVRRVVRETTFWLETETAPRIKGPMGSQSVAKIVVTVQADGRAVANCFGYVTQVRHYVNKKFDLTGMTNHDPAPRWVRNVIWGRY